MGAWPPGGGWRNVVPRLRPPAPFPTRMYLELEAELELEVELPVDLGEDRDSDLAEGSERPKSPSL